MPEILKTGISFPSAFYVKTHLSEIECTGILRERLVKEVKSFSGSSWVQREYRADIVSVEHIWARWGIRSDYHDALKEYNRAGRGCFPLTKVHVNWTALDRGV